MPIILSAIKMRKGQSRVSKLWAALKNQNEKKTQVNPRKTQWHKWAHEQFHVRTYKDYTYFSNLKTDCQGFSHKKTNGDPNRKPHYKSFHNFSIWLIKNHFSKWKIWKLFKQCPIVLSSQLSNLTYTFNHKQKKQTHCNVFQFYIKKGAILQLQRITHIEELKFLRQRKQNDHLYRPVSKEESHLEALPCKT